MSLEEIGEVTGVGRETVKSRLRYALAKLRQELTDIQYGRREDRHGWMVRLDA